MFFHSRRFNVWLVSFLAVLVIYFIYNRLSRTPPITTSDSGQPAESIMDVCDSNGKVGMVGEVGVGVVKNVRYTTLNAQKQVEREFGFEDTSAPGRQRLGDRKALYGGLSAKFQM